MSSGFFRGTNTEQDSRWGDAEKKLLRRTKFSKVLEQKRFPTASRGDHKAMVLTDAANDADDIPGQSHSNSFLQFCVVLRHEEENQHKQRVNMKKVNMDVMQRWITQRITSLLGFEDDIVVGTCVNYLSEEGKLDPKKLQLQLTGFLEKSTGTFMEELWGLLVDAQNSLGGIPSAFLQDKKQEILQAKEEQCRQEEELQRKMAEHQQELKQSKSVPERHSVADGDSSNTPSEPPLRPRAKDGKRASRWGKPEATLLVATATDRTGNAAEDVPETLGSSMTGHDNSDDGKLELRFDGGGLSSSRDEGSLERITEKSGELPDGRNEDGDEEGQKERKRKSKNKHGKKSDKKKSKSRHKDGDERERRHLRKIDEAETTIGHISGEEGVSSDDGEASEDAEIKDGVNMEEALRLRALAAIASKRGQGGRSQPSMRGK